MIISKTKVITIAILFSATAALAKPISNCGCASTTSQVNISSCNMTEVSKDKSPTWWNWLTSNESSQFHFFQLMELLHSNDDNITSVNLTDTQSDEQQA